MDEYVDEFLRHHVWRVMVRSLGPTLTLRLLDVVRYKAWWGYYKYPRLVRFLLGVQPHVLDHPSFYPHLVHRYDRQIVPQKAQRLNFLLFLVKIVLYALGIRFAWNVAVGTGHNTIELDYFFRLQSLGLTGKRAVLLRRQNPFHDDSVALYRRKFWLASNNAILCDWLFPVVIGTEKLRIDCGLARGKFQLRKDGGYATPPAGHTYLIELSKTENIAQWVSYYELRSKTEDKFPLSEDVGIDRELADFLGSKQGKIALIHMKLHVINATAAPTDPAAYELAIRWLIESGYQVVFVGREPFPALFATLGVLNYSESPFANYRHDIQLFATSSVAITAGSGISAHPDCMGKPYVYLDSWHLGMPMPSRKCVSVPALMKHRKTGRFLNLAEQLQLYMGSADKGGEAFPSRDYEARNAEPEEILQALQEALSLAAQPAPLTQMQQRFHKLIPATFQPLVKSRMSDFFLKKHNSLLPG